MPGPTTASKNSSGFDPRSIGSCQLWLDASDLSAVTGSSPVTAWRDKSLNVSSTTSVFGTPTLTTNAINGLRAILLNGSSSLTGSTTGSGTTLTVCIVATQSNTCAVNAGLVCLGRAGFADNTDAGSLAITNSTPLGSGLIVSTRTSVGSQIVNTGGTGLINGSSASPFVYILINDGTFVNTYLNGLIQTTANISRAGTFAYTNYVIGARAGSTTNVFYTGYIGEVLIFNSALTNTELNQVQGYLGWKWKTNATMDLTNQFYYYPPIVRGFLPFDINSCFMWLDGADNSTMTPTNPIGGTSITAWRDKSLNTVNYINGAGSIPNYVANNLIAPTYASGGGILFNPSLSGTFTNGTTQGFAAVGGFQLNITGFTAIVIARANGTTIFSYNSYFSWSGTGEFLDFDANGSTTWTSISTDNGANAGVTDYQTNFTLPNSVSIQCLQGTTTGACTYINGTATAYSSKVWSYTQTGTPVASNVWIGCQAPGNRTFSGTIYELILYNTALSLLERQKVEGYLANKWNIRSTLPATHPFRYFPPAVALPFFPTNLTQCTLWLDGADRSSASMTFTGNTVNAWKDKSGNGYNFTQASYSTSLPPLSNLTTGTGVSFGSLQGLVNILYPFPTTYTIFCVANQTTNSATYQYILHSPYNADFTIFFGSSNGNFTTYAGSASAWNDTTANSPTSAIATTTNTASLLCCTNNGTSLIPYFNGTALTTKTGTNAIATGLILGDGSTASTRQPWLGIIGEIIIYNAVLSTEQRQKVEGYLAGKWRLQNLLPSTHPYKRFITPSQESLLILTPSTIATVTLSGLSASAGTITWTTSTNAVGYYWYIGTTAGTPLKAGVVGAVLTTAVSFTFVVLTNYFAWVIPFGSTGKNGATTTSVAASYSAASPPVAPTTVTLTITNNTTMSVTWSGGSGATSFNAQIYKSALSNMTSFSTVTATPASSTSVTSPTSFALSTFAAASYYYYGAIITAINATGSTPSSMSTGVRYIPTFTASSLAGAPGNSLTTVNGTGAAASFNNLQSVVCDSTTNIYITEYGNLVRRVTTGGTVSAFTAVVLSFPVQLACDSTNTLYLCNSGTNGIRKVTTPGAVVTTIAGAYINTKGCSVDNLGNLYVSQNNGQRVSKIVISTGATSVLAGSGVAGFADGTGIAAQFNTPWGQACDQVGNVYVADYQNKRIRKITPAGVVTTFAGNGTIGSVDGIGTAARFSFPVMITCDPQGLNLFVSDPINAGQGNKIRQIVIATQEVITISGSGAIGTNNSTGLLTTYTNPYGLAMNRAGTILYICDAGKVLRQLVL